MHKHLIPPDGDLANLKGRQVLFLGNWTPTDSVLVFDWDRADLYVLDDGEEPAICAGRTPGGGPAPEHALPLSRTIRAGGHRRAGGGRHKRGCYLRLGLDRHCAGQNERIRGGCFRTSRTSRADDPLASLFDGDPVMIQCRTMGEEFSGDTTWYRIAFTDSRAGLRHGGLCRAGIPATQKGTSMFAINRRQFPLPTSSRKRRRGTSPSGGEGGQGHP